MISMCRKIVNNYEFNPVIALISNSDDHVTENETPIMDIKEVYEEGSDEMIVKERRAVKSERRVNDNHDYRGPARRLTIDRRR